MKALLLGIFTALFAQQTYSCSLPRFIFNPAALLSVGPLGHVYPDGWHIFPEKYIYPALKNDGVVYPPRCGITRRERITKVVAPGNIRVFGVERAEFYDPTRTHLIRTGYSIRFKPETAGCGSIDMYFGHMNTLQPVFNNPILGDWSDCNWHTETVGEILSCSKHSTVGLPIADGRVLGTIGGGTGTGCGIEDTRGLNFRTFDSAATNAFIEPGHYLPYYSYKTAICPMSLFSGFGFVYGAGDIQTNTATPSRWKSCGNISFDVPGTAQGNWFKWDAVLPDDSENIENQFALVYDELNPGIPVIAFGQHTFYGITYQPYGFTFPLNRTSGFVNRNFDAVVPDRQYCYDHLSLYGTASIPPTGVPGRILLYMTSDGWLYYQEQSAATDCSSFYTFNTEPIYYFRR